MAALLHPRRLMNRPRLSVLLRWVFAGLIAAGGIIVLARMFYSEGSVPLVGRSLLGIAALATSILLAAPELVRLAVSPLSHLLDSILLPSEEVVPPADLKLARFYGEGLRYDEACEEYERILQYHPHNAEAHLEGIRAAALAGNERLAAKFYHHAQRFMRSPDQRGLLDAVYAARNQLLSGEEGLETPELPALPENPDVPEPNSK